MKTRLLSLLLVILASVMPMKLWAADSGENTDVASDWTDSKQWIELTPNLWHIWGSEVDSTHCKADAVITGEMTPAWNLNTDIGAGACILGSENILWNQYADLSKYDKLIIFGTGGPGMRIMCNRIIDTGALKRLTVGFNEADSHWNADLKCLVIDLSEFKTMSCTATGESDAEGFKTGDERIDDFVHLHCLKNDWGGEFPITVTGVYVWKEKNEYPEPYAVLSENNTKLTFFYDDQKAIRGGMSVGPFSGKEDVPWYNQRERIITVEFDPSFANCTTLTSTAYWFNECDRLSTLIGIGNLKTDNVTNMREMFWKCSSLTSLDLSTFKTDNVTHMGYMFFSCYNLTNLNLSNFKTGNVKSMYGMFMGCSSLTSLDLSHFNTANVTSMLCMFYGCSNLTSLDISGFNTASVTEMVDMFNGCSGLTSLDVNNFNTANVESMFGMFNGCSSLTSLDLSTFKTDNVTTMGYMFNGCSGLTSLDVSGFNTAKVADMVCMFTDCSSLTSLDVSHFNTENVLGMSGMFSGCSGLKTIYAGSEWTTAAVTEGSGMFSGCTSLEGGAGTPYDSIHVDVSYAHIDGGENNPGYLTGRYGPNVLSIADITLPLNNEALLIVSYQFDVADKYVGYQFDLELPEELEFVTDDGNHVAFVKGDCHDDSYSVNANLDEGVLRVAGFSQYSSRTITGTSGVLLTFTIKPKSAVSIGQSFTGSIKNIIIATVEEQKELAPSSFTVTISQQVDPEPYAVLSENNTKLTFFYDDKKAVRNGMDVGPFTRSGSTVNSGWNEQRDNITTVEFDESFANCTTISSTSSWFYRFSNLTSIVGLSNLKTDNVIDMSSMFSYCSSLTSLDLSSFNTENVTDISRIFKDCTSLVSINISSFNTANVTLINGMFDGCSSLTNIDVSRFDTSKATDMRYMFSGCSSLTSLDLKNFNTANATRMEEMFDGCSGLTSINVSSFNTANVTEIGLMFGNCSSLTSLDLSSFNTSNVTRMQRMFDRDSLLTTIYVGDGWSTENVSEGSNVFRDCISLKGGAGTPYDADQTDYTYAHIDGGENNPGYFTDKNAAPTVEPYAVLSDNNTKLTFFYDDQKAIRNGMDVGPFAAYNDVPWYNQRESITSAEFDSSFANCTTLTSTAYWFYECKNMVSISGIEYLKTDNVTDMSWMFFDCSGLTSLDVSGFNTANVTDMGWMFSGCYRMTSLDVSNFNTENVTTMYSMFRGCSGLTSLDVSNFNTANVTGMGYMFLNCSNLKTIYVGEGWSTAKIEDSNNMFLYCTSLVGGAGTKYDANHVDHTYAHIDGGENNPGYLTWKGEGMTVNKLYIIGSGTAGEWNATTEMPFNDATKAFEYTIENTSTAWITFGIQPLNGDWGVFNNNYRYAIGNGNVVPVIGQEYQLVPSPETGCVMIEEQGKYFISVTKDLRMTIIKDGDEHPGTNIYVESEQAPYLYAFDANDQALNGEFPGNQMTKTVTIDGKQFWTTKISSTDPFNINIIDGNQYRTREIYVISDRYFTYLGLSSYRDVTEQYANAPEIQISSIALTGNHNEWGRNDLFTEVEPGKQYTMDVDLTNVTLEDDVMQFKLYANACAWLGITSLTLEAPSYVHSVGDPAVGASSRNIYMDLNEAPTRHFKFEAVWRGGTQMEEGWTLTITEVNPAEAEPYAVLSENNTKLTFFYDEKKATRGGMGVGPFYMNDAGYIEGRQWNDAVGSITTVVFDNSFVNCTSLTSTYGWFYGCKNLITITDISNLKTDNVADMSYMFSDCSSLKTLNVSGFKTDNVVNIWFMFSGCSSLTSLDVSGFNMGNVWGMYGMFSGCSKLTSLDLGDFNTENVRYMTGLFGECSSLTSLDVSGFNTTNVIDMNSMFRNCSSLTSLDLSNFNTSNVTDMSFMFWRCNNLLSLDISNFNTANAEMDRIFEECSSLASIKAGNANILTEEYAKIGNPNLLVYVNEARLAPSNVQNVVINGMAREIVLTDVTDGNNNWYAPLAFVAERISYTRNFTQSTTKGTSRGWESIALPFRVQTIQHETKGVIAPFNNSASNKHFWLRRLGDNGLQAATGIEANTPYVISMPNSEEYTADFNLNGRVTFSAQNVQVPATVTHTLALADSSIVMVPAMQRKERSSAVWALNVGEVRGQYFEGSVFERDYREVRPFEAYTVHRLENGQPAPRYVPLMDIGGTTGIETINLEPLTVNQWYDLEGRKLQGKPTQKGIYISNGKKVVVK